MPIIQLYSDDRFSAAPLRYAQSINLYYRSIGYDVPLESLRGRVLDILSCGAGMQSTALGLMSAENALTTIKHPDVPIYDMLLFCDLGEEPVWVYEQVEFIARACRKAGIPFYILYTHLYDDYIQNFGYRYVKSIPFWTLSAEGKKGRWRRACTIVYKIDKMQAFVKYEIMGYKYKGHIRPEHRELHRMHIGFSSEEAHRCSPSRHPLFRHVFPLVKMGKSRADNYAYNLDEWGLETKASACAGCPFHQNYFFHYIKQHYPETYSAVLKLDNILEEREGMLNMRDQMFISKSMKRIRDLSCDECQDAQTFIYHGKEIWNGF